jgi:ssDNA-binding Zn-finger/Zn-ribbon topoisomerase 1
MIPYARSEDNTLVSIGEVLPGLACNCFCPACGSQLIARKGLRNAHHFAHYRRPECTHALESSLHAMTKSILRRAGRIILPPIQVHYQDRPLAFARLFQFSSVRIEQHTDGMVPDILLESAGGRLSVEIAVHHLSSSRKIWKLQQARIPAIEIDVKTIHEELAGMGKGTDLAAFSDRIINDVRHKKWLFNPKQHAMEYRMRQTADVRKVKRRLYRGQYYFTVNGCPLGKRSIRSGPFKGNVYANVFTDCLGCPRCFEIAYYKKHVGYRQIATAPRLVYCLP